MKPLQTPYGSPRSLRITCVGLQEQNIENQLKSMQAQLALCRQAWVPFVLAGGLGQGFLRLQRALSNNRHQTASNVRIAASQETERFD